VQCKFIPDSLKHFFVISRIFKEKFLMFFFFILKLRTINDWSRTLCPICDSTVVTSRRLSGVRTSLDKYADASQLADYSCEFNTHHATPTRLSSTVESRRRRRCVLGLTLCLNSTQVNCMVLSTSFENSVAVQLG